MIVIEDTVVIFTYDVYSDILVKINNRSISEDILSVIYSIYTLRYCYNIQNLNVNQSLDTSSTNTSTSLISTDDLFYDFSKFYSLTNREQEIFRLLLNKKSNNQISEELYISIGTVKTHIHNIFQKVDVGKRDQLFGKYKDFNN